MGQWNWQNGASVSCLTICEGYCLKVIKILSACKTHTELILGTVFLLI